MATKWWPDVHGRRLHGQRALRDECAGVDVLQLCVPDVPAALLGV